MVRRKKSEEPEELPDPYGPPDENTADLNEIVAYNFKRARERAGLTQDEVADQLVPFLGQRLTQASISGIERGYGIRRREFDAQEILAFSCCFDLPLVWFFLPPPDDRRRLRGAPEGVHELYKVVLGREDQLEVLYERFRQMGMQEPDEAELAFEELTGKRGERSISDYKTRRKDLLINLLDHEADRLDKAADELGAFFDDLRRFGVRGYVSAAMNDADYGVLPENRGDAGVQRDESKRHAPVPDDQK